MRIAAWILVVAGVAAFSWSRVAGAGDDPPLGFDPFARPDRHRHVESRERRSEPVASAAWAPVLTATLVAGGDSLANLGGIVLELGQEAHGYRLLEVRDWEAVFMKDGETITLKLDPREEP